MNKTLALLILIVIFAFAVRVYKLDVSPPSLTWDEAAVGYNAWTIANYAKDEYGNFLPLYFRSFGEGKQPIHIYITAIFVKLLGLSEFSIRIPVALFGALNVLLVFCLSKILFNERVGLISAFFLAISPQNIHFSRFNHEANFALFFFMGGLLLFFYAIKKGKKVLPLSILFFILSMIAYNGAKIAVPPILLILIVLFFKRIKPSRVEVLVSFFIIILAVLLVILQPGIMGINRFSQAVQGINDIKKTPVYQNTNSLLLGRINLALIQYSWHFSQEFLFNFGDKNPILSSQGSGEIYKLDAFFLILGVLFIILKRSKEGIFVLVWALAGPLPGSLVAEAPHAGRAAFMMGSWQIVCAIGLNSLIEVFKKSYMKWLVISFTLVILLFYLSIYLRHYFTKFPKEYAISWQYGMKQVVEYIKGNENYDQFYTTSARAQPYIFFLFYLKQPLDEYLSTVLYNNQLDQSSNNVSAFGKYYFGGWSSIESTAIKRVLYVLSPSEYDGLLHRDNFDIKKIVYYPNGSTAFFLVSLR